MTGAGLFCRPPFFNARLCADLFAQRYRLGRSCPVLSGFAAFGQRVCNALSCQKHTPNRVADCALACVSGCSRSDWQRSTQTTAVPWQTWLSAPYGLGLRLSQVSRAPALLCAVQAVRRLLP